MDKPIRLEIAGESVELKSALISGRTNDFYGSPLSCYAGSLEIEELHTALYFAHRAIIRILCDELEVPIEKIDDFLLSALSEALVKEQNNRMTGESDLNVSKKVKFNNQN